MLATTQRLDKTGTLFTAQIIFFNFFQDGEIHSASRVICVINKGPEAKEDLGKTALPPAVITYAAYFTLLVYFTLVAPIPKHLLP